MSLRDELLARFPRLAELPPGCFVVGGAVRDLLLGVTPVDVDVASNEPAEAAAHVGPKVIQLGTTGHLSAWRVSADGFVYDFAGLLDGAIGPDLARRDFTINAMAVSLDDGAFLDPHGGEADLRARLVRMVDPTNFDDDPLRCLKAVRMAVRFDFEIEQQTLEAIRSRAETITTVAPERVTYELSIIFSADRFRRAAGLLRQTALGRPLFGRELDATWKADDLSLAGAMALLVEDPRAHARRWRWSVDLQRDVTALQRLLSMERPTAVDLFDAGETAAKQLPAVLRALGRDDALPWPDFSARALLSGEEIGAATGRDAGPELGRIKRALLEAQIREEVRTREEALEYVRREAG